MNTVVPLPVKPRPPHHRPLVCHGVYGRPGGDGLDSLARLNQLGWRKLRDVETRRAFLAQVKLMTTAHARAREAGMTLTERRKALPRINKIADSGDRHVSPLG